MSLDILFLVAGALLYKLSSLSDDFPEQAELHGALAEETPRQTHRGKLDTMPGL
jgi:hypothetical protein